MKKKYFSTGEFFYLDPLTKEKKEYSGYVNIINSVPHDLNGDELIIGDDYITTVNLSENFFDRTLQEVLTLPNKLEDCTFAPNDFLKINVLQEIVNNLEQNTSFIFDNCFLSDNNLPNSKIIPVLSPYTELSEDGLSKSEVKEWIWSNVSSGDIQNMWDKDKWGDNIVGNDWDFSNIVDTIVIPTDKYINNEHVIENKIYAVFLIYSDKIQLMNLNLCNENILTTGTDPLRYLNDDEKIEEINKRLFTQFSDVNNQTSTNINNLNIITIRDIDPSQSPSINFKNITSASHYGDYLFIVDSVLNGVYKYDISRCLTDRGAVNNQILLSNYVQGNGGVTEPYAFNNPLYVSSNQYNIFILDEGNSCVKVLDHDFNHAFTIRGGTFPRQSAKVVELLKYPIILDGINIEEESIMVFSEIDLSISVDIFTPIGQYITTKKFDQINLIEDFWTDPSNNEYSSNNPVKKIETLKKVQFSYNNSNYYYIITSRRIFKFQLSKLTTPIGLFSYYERSLTLDNMYWNNTYLPWKAVQDLGANYVKWTYDRNKEIINFPQNKSFTICGIPELDSDIIFNLIDNRVYYSDGDIQRIDNYDSNKLLFRNILTNEITYDKFNHNNDENTPILATVGEKVKKFINVNDIPVETEEDIEILPLESINNSIFNGIIFFKEENVFTSLLLNTNFESYDTNIDFHDDYVSVLPLNKILYKLYFNLEQIKKYLYGKFVGGFNVDNIMILSNVESNVNIENLHIDPKNYFLAENETISMALNRSFELLYDLQLKILSEIQTKNFNNSITKVNTYKII